eukprot:scaffold565_cov379-Pinguiococcus_pyrenoidosus.AAC.14
MKETTPGLRRDQAGCLGEKRREVSSQKWTDEDSTSRLEWSWTGAGPRRDFGVSWPHRMIEGEACDESSCEESGYQWEEKRESVAQFKPRHTDVSRNPLPFGSLGAFR